MRDLEEKLVRFYGNNTPHQAGDALEDAQSCFNGDFTELELNTRLTAMYVCNLYTDLEPAAQSQDRDSSRRHCQEEEEEPQDLGSSGETTSCPLSRLAPIIGLSHGDTPAPISSSNLFARMLLRI